VSHFLTGVKFSLKPARLKREGLILEPKNLQPLYGVALYYKSADGGVRQQMGVRRKRGDAEVPVAGSDFTCTIVCQSRLQDPEFRLAQ